MTDPNIWTILFAVGIVVCALLLCIFLCTPPTNPFDDPDE